MKHEDAARLLQSPEWRLNHLYRIIVKDSGKDNGLVVPFALNEAQRQLHQSLHYRNIILKARQLGFSTYVCILWLDTALFSPSPVRCGIIADNRENSETLFRDKIKFAYDHLPDELKAAMPLSRDSANELRFAHNGASIRVATSMRSGTIHRLHISEFGKICARYPDKAREIITGSIPAVPASGILVIESTAEGREGDFYRMTQRAIAMQEANEKLTERDYRFHFFPWHDNADYAIPALTLTEKQQQYFADIEGKTGKTITPEQRAWYVRTLEADFSGDVEKMNQEYPSTPEEAFQVSIEGCFFASQLAAARKEGRICAVPLAAAPVNTFWDIGHSGQSDATGIWFHQRIGAENRFLRYREWADGETLTDYVRVLQSTGYVFGKHYLPHDAEHKRLGAEPDRNRSIREMLESLLPGQTFVSVPRVTDITTGIQATRNVFASCWFDAEGCREGIAHLEGYRKEWSETYGCWKKEPRHDEHSHAADAFRQFGQEADAGNPFAFGYAVADRFRSKRTRTKTDWRA